MYPLDAWGVLVSKEVHLRGGNAKLLDFHEQPTSA